MTKLAHDIQLDWCSDHWRGRFTAMASPCEVLIDSESKLLAEQISQSIAVEALRIEHKFSRYRDDNIIAQINQCKTVTLDGETSELIEFATTLHQLSNGLFDITSGVLRKAWQFNMGNAVPNESQVQQLLTHIGWHKVSWEKPRISLPQGMEIDLGGIGKEYAVDRCTKIASDNAGVACLINFGGDLAVTGPRHNNTAWQVAIESTSIPSESSGKILSLKHGALATSGDVRRYVEKHGKRYGHILNPKTGWPIEGAPRSVTVACKTCTEAGMLATLSMLQGEDCENFIEQEKIQAWCIR